MSIGDAADTVSDVLSDSIAALTPSLPSSQAVRASKQSKSPSTERPDDVANGSLASGRGDLASTRDITRMMSTTPNWQSAGSTLSLHRAINTELSHTRDRYSRDSPCNTCRPSFEPQCDTNMLRTCTEPALYNTQFTPQTSHSTIFETFKFNDSNSKKDDVTKWQMMQHNKIWKIKLLNYYTFNWPTITSAATMSERVSTV